MPKETFYNLAPEKQERIMAAAKAEFSKVPLQEASIAKIIKMAGISRGSFYQYFEDKEDLYYYFFESIKKSNEQSLERQLKIHQGDLFAAAKAYFDIWISEAFESEHASFYRHLFMHIDYRGTSRVSPDIAKDLDFHEKHRKRAEAEKNKVAEILDIIDTDLLTITDETEIRVLIKVIIGMMFSSVNHAFKLEMLHLPVDLAVIKKEYNMKLDWMQFGVVKSKEK